MCVLTSIIPELLTVVFDLPELHNKLITHRKFELMVSLK